MSENTGELPIQTSPSELGLETTKSLSNKDLAYIQILKSVTSNRNRPNLNEEIDSAIKISLEELNRRKSSDAPEDQQTSDQSIENIMTELFQSKNVHKDLKTSAELTLTTIELAQQLMKDPLTGAYSRTYFEQIIQVLDDNMKNRSDEKYSIIMIDVDNLKTVNDSKGHESGDRLLTQVVKKLNHSTRLGDVVARLSGDEFAIILPNTDLNKNIENNPDSNDKKGVQEVVISRIRKEFSDPNGPSISMGFAVADKNLTPEEILKKADQMMYQEKTAKKEGQ